MAGMSNNSNSFEESSIPSLEERYDYSEYYDKGTEDASPCVYGTHASRFIPVLYSLFFVVGFPANMLVLWVILSGAQMKTMTDVSLLNLAIADLLLLFTLPFLAHQAKYSWIFGDAMCTLVLSVYYIGFYAGIFFIVLMSFDRYLAIVHAVFALRIRTKAFGLLASMFIWMTAIAASFPELLHLEIENNDTEIYCSTFPNHGNYKTERSAGFIKMNILGLLIPLSIVGYCYFRVLRRLLMLRTSKKLAVRLVAVVMLVFFCCWTPYNIAAFVKTLEMKHILNLECESSKMIQLMLQITEAVAYSHSSLNPFLYVFVGEKFRRHLARLLRRTPFFQVQCMKGYITQAAGSVYSQTTSLDERSVGI